MHTRSSTVPSHSASNTATSSSGATGGNAKFKFGSQYALYIIAFLVITIMYLILVMNFMSGNHDVTTSILHETSTHNVGGKEKLLQAKASTLLPVSLHKDIDELKARSEKLLSQYGANEKPVQDSSSKSTSSSEEQQPPAVMFERPVTKKETSPEVKQPQQQAIAVEESLPSPTDKPLSVVKESHFADDGKHFPPAISFSTIPLDKFVSDESKAVLIVGGTDGSGTRRVVQILAQLGTTMVSEDPETYDIHADIVGGWPKLVRPVVQQMRRLDYDPEAYSTTNPKEYKKTSDALQRLLGQVDRDSSKPTSYRLAVGGVLPKPKDGNVTARNVKYGFKAPVSMTLLPYWVHALPHTKFVHVLRDGRDIAFSANQGPVDKFYQDMYGSDAKPEPIKAIRLWSDWNSQLHSWAKHYVESRMQRQLSESSGAAFSPSRSFGYIAIHTEDVVSESRAIRFSAIHHLARFVGSTISNDKICCLAVEDIEFMGSHDRSQLKQKQKAPGQQSLLNSRYGKWKRKTEKNPNLLKALYVDGSTGLKTFGYDPLRKLPDDAMITEDGYHCNLKPKECVYEEPEPVIPNPNDYVIPDKCKVMPNTDLKGDDITATEYDSKDPATCCK